ncbi:MAG: hypothetical protein HKN09_07790 [Saprospiraceae bacterium]|nr:hypothetical protein [Saprospiraceae bacterium]
MWVNITLNALIHGAFYGFIFLALIIAMGLSGIFKKIRDDEGRIIKPLNPEAYLGFALFIALMFFSIYKSNMHLDIEPNWCIFWINGFLTYVVMSLMDLIILDYLLVVVWHPAKLKLPDTAYYTTMKPHVEGFFRGLIPGFLISGILAVGATI